MVGIYESIFGINTDKISKRKLLKKLSTVRAVKTPGGIISITFVSKYSYSLTITAL